MKPIRLTMCFVRVVAVALALVLPGGVLADDGLKKFTDAINALSKQAGGPKGNLVVNGGFEEPVVRPGGYVTYRPGQSFTGWQVVGPSGGVSPISGDYANAGIRFVAREGKQWLDLTGPSASTDAGVQQTVRTTSGQVYDLAFWVGNVSARGFGTTSTVEVLVDGQSLGLARNDQTIPGQLGWGLFKMQVTATGTAMTLAFVNRDPSNDNSNGLDAVSLVPVATIPAPAATGRDLTGEYVYQGDGTATISQIGDEVHMFLNWTPLGAGPHYEVKGKLAGDTVTGQWYSHYARQGWFNLVGKVSANGDIDLSQSDDPINANFRKIVLTRKR